MPRYRWLLLVPVVAMVALALFDILREPGPLDPVETALDVAEKVLIVGAMAATAWAVSGLREVRGETRALRDRVVRAAARNEAFRSARRAELAAFGEAVAAEFRGWGLSEAESDVAGLLLKGCSMKEIALARHTSEATIRQQAQALYRKAGVSGRAELSAYFLDGVFSAAAERAAAPDGRKPVILAGVREAGLRDGSVVK